MFHPFQVYRHALRLRFFLFHVRSSIHRSYTRWFFFCEWMNLANVLGQWFLINIFLNGGFALYGNRFVEYFYNSELFGGDETSLSNPMDAVFPKVTACTFQTYGVSGHLQDTHGYCILPLNILNEKLYTVLWFWYVFLIAVSSLTVAVRLISFSAKGLRK